MVGYTARRVAWVVPILLGVATLTFFVSRAMPGDPAKIFAGSQATDTAIAAIRAQFGFDKPLGVQYLDYLAGLARGDLGTSVRTGHGVLDDLTGRFPATIELILAALIVALAIGVPLGVAAGASARRGVERFARGVSTLGVSIPEFWLGLLLIVVFYSSLDIAPAPVGRLDIGVPAPDGVTGLITVDALLAGDLEVLGNAAGHLLLPALALGLPAAAPIIRLSAEATASLLRSDHLFYTRAIGTPPRVVYLKHVLRNIAPIVTTMTALIFGFLVGGAVVVEEVFAWPGVGLYAIDSLHYNDYAAVQGFVLLAAAVYILLFLAVDLVNTYLDPRKRLT